MEHKFVRTSAREMALQSLFQLDVDKAVLEDLVNRLPDKVNEFGPAITVTEALAAVKEEHEEEKREQAFAYAQELVEGVLSRQEELDALINKYSVKWSVERMPLADKLILRIAAYELFYAQDKVEAGIAINEAVEMGKAYGTDESSRFINGLLGQMVRSNAEGISRD